MEHRRVQAAPAVGEDHSGEDRAASPAAAGVRSCMMELTLLTVPACPNAAVFEERLAAALADYPDTLVRRREVANEREAAAAGMHGSPTLLIDGVDPFAVPGQAPSLSCRLYRDSAGHTEGAPSVDALRRILQQASAGG